MNWDSSAPEQGQVACDYENVNDRFHRTGGISGLAEGNIACGSRCTKGSIPVAGFIETIRNVHVYAVRIS